jgi:hypothetical protein
MKANCSPRAGYRNAVAADLHPRYARLRREMTDQLERTAAAENHWLMYLLLAWQHLAACVASHFLAGGETGRPPSAWPWAALWMGQILVGVLTVRLITGKPRIEDSPLQPVVRILLAVFVLLCCNVALLTVMTGQGVFVFLPFLATLGSFLFLVLSLFLARRWMAAALAMFATGSLMARFPAWGFLIYGVSWLLLLHVVSAVLWRRRRHWLKDLQASPGVCPSAPRATGYQELPPAAAAIYQENAAVEGRFPPP